MRTTGLLFLGLFACACSGSLEPGETADDSDLAATGGIAENTQDAAAVLRVANKLSAKDLKAQVGLSSFVAKSIDLYRLGDDKAAGTADDETFDTLAELDAIPGVGPVQFGKLLAFAKSQATPTEPSGCEGPVLSSEDALALFAPGATSAFFGGYTVHVRSRRCTAATGCAAWQDATTEKGTSSLALLDSEGNVGISFADASGKTWMSNIPLGQSPDASALGSLLDEPDTYTYATGPVRETCLAMTARKIAKVDDLHTEETEVELRAAHSLQPAASDFFKTPQTVSMTCTGTRWDYAYTCQGMYTTSVEGGASGTIEVSADGTSVTFVGTGGWADYTSSFDGTFPLSNGRASNGGPISDTTTYSIGLNVSSTAATVALDYSWTSYPNWCGASTHLDFHCVGSIVAP